MLSLCHIATIYRTAGNIGGELNLAVWRLAKRPSNLNPSNLSAIYVYTYYFTRARARARILYYGTTAKFKSANIFISAARDQTAKFKDRQYFRLYGIPRPYTHEKRMGLQ